MKVLPDSKRALIKPECTDSKKMVRGFQQSKSALLLQEQAQAMPTHMRTHTHGVESAQTWLDLAGDEVTECHE